MLFVPEVLVIAEQTMEMVEDEDESVVVKIVPEPGKFYVVLGDSFEGYYLVRCLSSHEDYFCGKYMCCCTEAAEGENVLFKETVERDNFMYSSLVSELFIVTEVSQKKNSRYTVFSVDKMELNDILITIGEMEDD